MMHGGVENDNQKDALAGERRGFGTTQYSKGTVRRPYATATLPKKESGMEGREALFKFLGWEGKKGVRFRP